MKKQTGASVQNGPKKTIGETKVVIRRLPTGVRGLDDIVGGGVPEFSFNIIAGTPGCGKTTLAHQIIFANATAKKPALYFTVLGEPAVKMLRYQQQYSFFDESKLGAAIRFIPRRIADGDAPFPIAAALTKSVRGCISAMTLPVCE